MNGEGISPLLHFAMVIFVFTCIIVVIYTGKIFASKNRINDFDKILATIICFIWITYNIYYFSPQIFDWSVSLPLHVCYLIGIISVFALVSKHRVWRSLLYFSATLLAGQAIATPVGIQDPSTIRFWMFWTLHACIISTSWYDVVIRGYRPYIQDIFTVYLFNLIYVALILPFNVTFGFNYGYIGPSKPDSPTIVDILGEWPDRVFIMILIAASAQVLMFLPWKVLGSYGRRAKNHVDGD